MVGWRSARVRAFCSARLFLQAHEYQRNGQGGTGTLVHAQHTARLPAVTVVRGSELLTHAGWRFSLCARLSWSWVYRAHS